MKKTYFCLLLLTLCLFSSLVSRAQNYTANFTTSPAASCTETAGCESFQITLGGIVYVFAFAPDNSGGSFKHLLTGGVDNGPSMDLESSRFDTLTTERVKITRLDGALFNPVSMYVDNLNGKPVTLQLFIGASPVGYAQTVSTKAKQTVFFGGNSVSSIQLTSKDFYKLSLDDFTVCVTPSVSFNAAGLCLGAATSFTSTSTSVLPGATYEWDFNSDNMIDASIANPSYTYPAAGDYTAKLTIKQGGCVSSTTKAITINTPPTASLSGGGTVCTGNQASLSIALTGTAPWSLTYTDGTTLFSQTNILTSPLIIEVTPATSKTYTLTAVTNATCTGTVGGSAQVTVNALPAIGSQPAGATRCVGGSVSFSVGATGSALGYQWKKDGVNIPEATGSAYSLNNLTLSDAGEYTVEVRGTCSPAVVSEKAVLVVNQAPLISSQLVDEVICAGGNASFSVTATNATGYQWQVNSGSGFVNLSNNAIYNGATTGTLTVTGATSDMNGYQYRAVAIGACPPAVTSNSATLNVGNPTALGSFTPLAGPVLIGTSVKMSIGFSGSAPGTAVWNWNDGTTSKATVDGFTLTGTHLYATPGVYTPTLTVNSCGGSGSSSYEYIVVYDPNGGFMTGSGWFNSPTGAYRPQPSLEGRVNFGFVSKYKKGTSVPEGSTQFEYRMGSMRFHSSAYEWLVISGSKGQYRGSGTINGRGNYGFLLTTIDGGKRPDRLRMKIWDNTSGQVVYDNGFGATDTADPTTVITGGAILIKAPSKNARESYSSEKMVSFSDIPLEAYPNPFREGLTIDLSHFEPGKIGLNITDLQGHVVYRQEVELEKERPLVELHLEGLKQGVYLMQATSSQRRHWVKLIKL